MNPSGMRLQRDQALSCLVLSVGAALAVFLSVFGPKERVALENARGAVALHEGLLRQSAAVLQQNRDALGAARAAFLAEKGARQR